MRTRRQRPLRARGGGGVAAGHHPARPDARRHHRRPDPGRDPRRLPDALDSRRLPDRAQLVEGQGRAPARGRRRLRHQTIHPRGIGGAPSGGDEPVHHHARPQPVDGNERQQRHPSRDGLAPRERREVRLPVSRHRRIQELQRSLRIPAGRRRDQDARDDRPGGSRGETIRLGILRDTSAATTS